MRYIRTFFNIFLVAIFVTSCSSGKKDYKTVSDKQDSLAFHGNLIPYKVDQLPGCDSVVVGFMSSLASIPSAAAFFLDKQLPNSEKYIQLLNKAMKNKTPVQVYFFNHTNRIGMIKNAS